MPLVARTLAEWTLLPLAVPAMLLALALILRRAACDAGLFARWQTEPVK